MNDADIKIGISWVTATTTASPALAPLPLTSVDFFKSAALILNLDTPPPPQVHGRQSQSKQKLRAPAKKFAATCLLL